MPRNIGGPHDDLVRVMNCYCLSLKLIYNPAFKFPGLVIPAKAGAVRPRSESSATTGLPPTRERRRVNNAKSLPPLKKGTEGD